MRRNIWSVTTRIMGQIRTITTFMAVKTHITVTNGIHDCLKEKKADLFNFKA